jgi:hypothetical protein
VYSRELEGETLTIVPSGWTYKNTFVLYDRETGTMWYPYRKGLKGIQGTHFEKWLPKVPSMDTQLRKWLKKYPDSKILK